MNETVTPLYYTAKQAKETLSVSQATFQRWGHTGRITRVFLAGRKRPAYQRREIDAMVTQVHFAVALDGRVSITFSRKDPRKRMRTL